jgi:Fe-S-cluster containining protein
MSIANPLPVLQSSVSQMQLCGICPDPGRCCRKMVLSSGAQALTYWKDGWEDAARADMQRRGLPFEPLAIAEEYADSEGIAYVSVFMTCPELLPNGRCGIYEDRPRVCRSYVPASDRLCVFPLMEAR